jgi:hypothetical protein
VAADHPESVRLEVLSPDSVQARGLDTKKSISVYLNRQRVPIKTCLSRTDLEECIQKALEDGC